MCNNVFFILSQSKPCIICACFFFSSIGTEQALDIMLIRAGKKMLISPENFPFLIHLSCEHFPLKFSSKLLNFPGNSFPNSTLVNRNVPLIVWINTLMRKGHMRDIQLRPMRYTMISLQRVRWIGYNACIGLIKDKLTSWRNKYFVQPFYCNWI